jgi:hypothetical protein
VPDEEVLQFAISHRRAVLPINRRHFVQLHSHTPGHHGIVVCSLDPDFEGMAARLEAEVRGLDTLDAALIRVNRPNKP